MPQRVRVIVWGLSGVWAKSRSGVPASDNATARGPDGSLSGAVQVPKALAVPREGQEARAKRLTTNLSTRKRRGSERCCEGMSDD